MVEKEERSGRDGEADDEELPSDWNQTGILRNDSRGWETSGPEIPRADSIALSRLTVQTKEIGARNSQFIRPAIYNARVILSPLVVSLIRCERVAPFAARRVLGQLSAISRMGARTRKEGSRRYTHTYIYNVGPRGRRR